MTAPAMTRAEAASPPLPDDRLAHTLPPEERLLLLSAGGAGNDAAIRRIARATVDWQRFLGLAQIERAVPVVHQRLRKAAGDVVPEEVQSQMRRLGLIADFAMVHLESRLRESLRALESERIRVMLLKGAALANSAYAGARQRPMSDLDVLVDPSNARLARRLMLGAGWREVVGGVPEYVYEHHHHMPPLHDTRSAELQLEIHTALFPERQPFAFDAGMLWARARRLDAASPNAFVPDSVHLLLHACLHFLWSHQGRFGVWRTIRDVDALTRRDDVDWDEFVRTARDARGGTSCYWTFRIAEITAAVRVPPAVMDQLRPPRSAYLLQAIERHFVRNLFPVEFACPSVTLDHALWELAVMPGRSGHGAIRPWDDEAEFVAPGSAAAPVTILRRERLRRFLASSGYIRTLLRSRG